MVDSPWLTASSRTELFGTTSGSNIALHSIYGSQVSQLPLTLSKASLEEEEEEEEEDDDGWLSSHRHHVSHSQTNVRQPLLRPKTAPASKSLTRLNRPSSAVHSMTVNTTIRRLNQNRPTTALPHQVTAKRMNSSQQLTVHHHHSAVGSVGEYQRRASRPSTAQPLRGGRSIGARPSTARPLTGYISPSIAGSSDVLPSTDNNFDEIERMKEKTVPVSLTNVPRYFNFWNEKPIRQREWGVPTNDRRSRKYRPKSDYGLRGLNRNNKNLEDGMEGKGNGRGGNDTELGILFEVADGSLSSGDQDGRGNKRKKGRRKGHKGNGSDTDDDNSSRTNNGTEFDDKDRLDDGLNDSSLLDTGNKFRGDESVDEFNNRNKGMTSGEGENEDDHNLEYQDLKGGNDEDNDAENDDYFSQKKTDKCGKSKSLNDLDSYATGYCSAMSTRFELPMDLKLLEVMTPMEYLSKHCIISQRRKFHYLKTFTELKNKDIPSHTVATTLTDKDAIIAGIIKVHFEVVTKDEVYYILQVADYTSDKAIDFQLFGALCALTERRYCSQRPGFSRKELIEIVDFEALDWRLRNCVISHSLKTLFQLL